MLCTAGHGWGSSAAPVVTAALSNASWICTSLGHHGRIDMPLNVEQVAALSGILNRHAKVPQLPGPEPEAPRVVPPSLAPDLRIEVRSKDGQQRLAVVQGSSELGFLTFRVFKSAIPESSSDPELALQSFSIHDKKAIARFYATVRRKR